MEIINIRRSIRNFSYKEIELDKLELILRSAMQAPSAGNQQPWHFLVIKNRERLNGIAEKLKTGKMLHSANLAIVLLIDKNALRKPTMVPQDMAASCENILLEAASLGIGSCWIGIYSHEDRMEAMQEVLNVPDNFDVFSIVALGYPNNPNDLKFVDRFDSTRVHYEVL